MNLNSLAHLVRDDMTTCSVVFNSNRNQQYFFKISKALAAKCVAGDQLIVHTCNGMKVAYLVEVHEESQIDPEKDEINYSWAFQRVAIEILEEQLFIEGEIEEKLQARRKLSHRQQALAALGITDLSEFTKSLAAPSEG